MTVNVYIPTSREDVKHDSFIDSGMKTVEVQTIPVVNLAMSDYVGEIADTGVNPIGAGFGTRGTREAFSGKFKDLVMINLLITKSCNFRCDYCQPAGSLIRMADFSTKKIEDIVEGDIVLGFDENTGGTGTKRSVYPTVVTKTFNRMSDHYYAVNTDSSQIMITGEHPILSGSPGRTGQRWTTVDRLSTSSSAMGVPLDIVDPIMNDDYKIGYMVAALLGDGHISSIVDGNGYAKHHVRFVVSDQECNDRFIKFAEDLNFHDYNLYRFCISKKNNLFRESFTVQSKSGYDFFRSLIDSNLNKNYTLQYAQGFLAGIYDTEGTIANCANVIRIYNSNPDVITQTTSALKLINIPYVIEKCKSIVNKQVYSIRILSDSTLKNLSFILSINPAIKRKGIDNFLDRSLLKRQNILSIDRIDGPVKVFSFETESHTYIADTIAVHNCVEDKDLPNEKMWTIPILEDLCQWIRRQSPKNKVNLSFFGGEPLLEWESIKEFMTYGLKHHSDIIDFNISTNIVLLDREKLDWLDKNTEPGQITFLLSLDGFERVKSRHAAGNKNNNLMHIIRKNLAVMRDDYNRLFKNSSFRVSVMPEYLDILEEDLFEMVDYGPENIIIHPVTTEPSAPWTEDKYVMLTDLINKVCRYAIETSSVEIECMEGVSKKDHNCGAGHSMLAMNADGKIYSCYFTAHAELDFDVIGDFRSDEVNEIRANIYQLNPNYDPKCISCDKKYCFQCSVKNLLHHGQHFCSSMWCKELADLYSDTLDLCLKTRINSRISKNAKHGLDISHVNEEMECMINDMAGLINSLLSNAPYQPKGDDCGCHSATSSKLDLLQNIMDLSSIKLGLEAIHNQRFPGNAVSSV